MAMLMICGSAILQGVGLLVWFFGIKRYVSQNGGTSWTGANIPACMWNDFEVARELRRETGAKCSLLELLVAIEVLAAILIVAAVFALT